MPDSPRLDPAAFIDKWSGSGGAERANAQSFLNDLAAVLGVAPPDPTTGDPQADGYVYERPLAFQDGRQSKGFIDLYKRGAFVLETKQGADAKRTAGGRKLRTGHGKRGTRAWDATMDAARNQAEGYARNLEAAEPPPPFVVVCDVGFCLDLYADFSGSGRLYKPFPDAESHRLTLAELADPNRGPALRARLADVFEDPESLDPTRRQARVTVERAGDLAALAAELDGATDADGQPMDAEAVGGFLSRVLFCMFAEDAELIPSGAFRQLLNAYADDLDALPFALADFFDTMDRGGFVGEVRAKLRRFNGALFKDTRSPRLSERQRDALAKAAGEDWSEVEPSIFGTLLERALDPTERHALGAHFTPRAYVERLVGPAVLEPLRDEWAGVRAAASRLIEQAEAATGAARTRRRNEARATLSGFLSRLASVRVLDPACGSGNFLYVTFAGLKALEDEARAAAERLVGEAVGEGFGVTPRQMRGIELNARAAAIADLVLWIGYLQWHRQRYGGNRPLPEPVLEGYGQVEHRDAVLTDEGTPAPWPAADFIVGNPPFIGNKRMRDALGSDYTERLRAAYPEVPESADFVMYWWHRAAEAVRLGDAERFGFVTTNSITQTFNRRVVERHVGADDAPLALTFAVPDHPWVDTADGAAVRVSMTVGASVQEVAPEAGRLAVVADEREVSEDGIKEVDLTEYVGEINSDLSVGADVTQAEPLRANSGLSFRGVILSGQPLVVTAEEADKMGRGRHPDSERFFRPYWKVADAKDAPQGQVILDTFGMSQSDVRTRFPEAYEHLLSTMKPLRESKLLDKNGKRKATITKDAQDYADRWWQAAKPRDTMRTALNGLSRYLVTPYVSKHRLFLFLDGSAVPDDGLIAIATADALHLGVLSSRTHVEWALAAGGTLEDRPRYNNSLIFEPFPFPTPTDAQADAIRQLGEAIDAHRKARQAEHPGLGLTDLYNAVEGLRAGRALTAKEQCSADDGLAHTLLDLHRQLDRAVLDAYGWADLDAEAPTFRAAVLGRLVALNAERRAEEEAGHVRHLRPSFQAPGGSGQAGLDLRADVAAPEQEAPAVRPWPGSLAAQMHAVRQAVTAGASTSAEVAARFERTRPAAVAEVLDALAELGLVSTDGGTYAA